MSPSAERVHDPLALLQNLADVLVEESDVLRTRRPDALTEVVARKGEVLEQLRRLAQTSALRAESPAALPPEARARARALVRRCEERNAANGAAIELLSRHTRRALEILAGHTLQDRLYDPGGLRRPVHRHRYTARV